MLHDHRLARELRRKNAGERADDQIEIKALRAALETRDAEIKAFAEKAAAEIKDHGKAHADTKAALQSLAEAGTALQAHLQAVEQKLARRGGGSDAPAIKSLGESFAESDEWKAMKARGAGTARISLKAVTSITSATTGDGAAGVNITPQRLPFIVRPGERTLTIRDLMLPVKRPPKLTPDWRPMLTPLARADGAVPIGAEP